MFKDVYVYIDIHISVRTVCNTQKDGIKKDSSWG